MKADGTYHGKASANANGEWYGSLAGAKTKCDASAECTVIHDWGSDDANYRVCKAVTSEANGAATTLLKPTTPTPAPTAGYTAGPAASNSGIDCMKTDGTYKGS